MGKKMGRPTDNPKTHSITVRLDEKSIQILDEYVKQNGVSKTDAIREAIAKLKETK